MGVVLFAFLQLPARIGEDAVGSLFISLGEDGAEFSRNRSFVWVAPGDEVVGLDFPGVGEEGF